MLQETWRASLAGSAVSAVDITRPIERESKYSKSAKTTPDEIKKSNKIKFREPTKSCYRSEKKEQFRVNVELGAIGLRMNVELGAIGLSVQKV